MNPNDVISNDDVALVLSPNFEKDGTWSGTLDLNIAIMPVEKGTEESIGAIEELTNMLITCFRLITEDEEFHHQVLKSMIQYVESGELLDEAVFDEVESMIKSSDNVYKLNAWTKTRGNA
jgi:hypothetical protein